MSALPPKADMDQSGCDVRFVPKADILQCVKKLDSVTRTIQTPTPRRSPRGVRGRIKFNRVEQVARRLSVQSSQLAIQGNMASFPSLAHRMGDLGHLLFQSAVRRVASRVGDFLCGTRYMAALAVVRSARVRGLRRTVSWRGRLVPIHFSISRPTVASGSRRNAPGDD